MAEAQPSKHGRAEQGASMAQGRPPLSEAVAESAGTIRQQTLPEDFFDRDTRSSTRTKGVDEDQEWEAFEAFVEAVETPQQIEQGATETEDFIELSKVREEDEYADRMIRVVSKALSRDVADENDGSKDEMKQKLQQGLARRRKKRKRAEQ